MCSEPELSKDKDELDRATLYERNDLAVRLEALLGRPAQPDFGSIYDRVERERAAAEAAGGLALRRYWKEAEAACDAAQDECWAVESVVMHVRSLWPVDAVGVLLQALVEVAVPPAVTEQT